MVSAATTAAAAAAAVASSACLLPTPLPPISPGHCVSWCGNYHQRVPPSLCPPSLPAFLSPLPTLAARRRDPLASCQVRQQPAVHVHPCEFLLPLPTLPLLLRLLLLLMMVMLMLLVVVLACAVRVGSLQERKGGGVGEGAERRGRGARGR